MMLRLIHIGTINPRKIATKITYLKSILIRIKKILREY